MREIIALTHCLAASLSPTTLRQLRQMVAAMVCLTGRVTTLGLSRWTEKGGSVRTLQRWMQTPIDWAAVPWTVVQVHLLDREKVYILAGDEVVVSKAGKTTHGLGRFYSSLAQRAIPSVSFLALSLVDVEKRLHLLSKLRHNAALYLPYTGAKPQRGPTPRYGDKLDYHALPAAALVHTDTDGTLVTETYHLTVLHKDFPDPLNLVVLVKTQTRTGKRAHAILFSTDLALSPTQLADYYCLRFQIEFNFRDAKQFWGLEDFMNGSEQAVTNAANLAFLMVSLSALLLLPHRHHPPDFSVLDLKAHYRARRYLDETIKSLPISPDAILFSRLWHRFSRLGGIRARHTDHLAA